MDDETLITLILLTVAAAVAMYTGGRRTLSALARRRRDLESTVSGVRAHGVVSAVHPMDRASGRHSVAIRVHDGQGRSWDAADDSGTGGYLLQEGTPVTVLYAPGNPSNSRVERAAFPEPSMGDYPLYRDGIPAPPSLVAALSPLAGALVVLGAAVLAALNMSGTVLLLLPPLFALAGLGLLVRTVYRMLTGKIVRGEHSASATGVVTDCWTKTTWKRDGNRRRKVRVHPFTVRFRAADGREVHLRHAIAGSNFAPEPGERLRVDYDPAHPPHYALADHPNPGALPVLLPLLVGVVFTLVGSVLTFVFWVLAPF